MPHSENSACKNDFSTCTRNSEFINIRPGSDQRLAVFDMNRLIWLWVVHLHPDSWQKSPENYTYKAKFTILDHQASESGNTQHSGHCWTPFSYIPDALGSHILQHILAAKIRVVLVTLMRFILNRCVLKGSGVLSKPAICHEVLPPNTGLLSDGIGWSKSLVNSLLWVRYSRLAVKNDEVARVCRHDFAHRSHISSFRPSPIVLLIHAKLIPTKWSCSEFSLVSMCKYEELKNMLEFCT